MNDIATKRSSVLDRVLVLEMVRVTEAAAIAASSLIGRGDEKAADAAAVEAMRAVRGTIMPFPGGVVRSGSKVGSKYPALMASTNDAFCPALTPLAKHSELDDYTRCVMEIVIDGLTEADVAASMRAGIAAIVARGGAAGVTRISAGNYGGKLGPFHFHLHKLIGEGAA